MGYLLDNEKLNGNGGKVYINRDGKQAELGEIKELKIDEVEQLAKDFKSIDVQHEKISGSCTINKEENPDFFKWMEGEFDSLEQERQSFVHQLTVKGVDVIEVCLFKGLGAYEKIGGEYDCRFDAMQAAKNHAARSGKQQIYGLFENGLNTHIIKTNGIYVELTEIPVHKQTRLEEV